MGLIKKIIKKTTGIKSVKGAIKDVKKKVGAVKNKVNVSKDIGSIVSKVQKDVKKTTGMATGGAKPMPNKIKATMNPVIKKVKMGRYGR